MTLTVWVSHHYQCDTHRVDAVEEPRFARSVLVRPEQDLFLQWQLYTELSLIIRHPVTCLLHQLVINVFLQRNNTDNTVTLSSMSFCRGEHRQHSYFVIDVLLQRSTQRTQLLCHRCPSAEVNTENTVTLSSMSFCRGEHREHSYFVIDVLLQR